MCSHVARFSSDEHRTHIYYMFVYLQLYNRDGDYNHDHETVNESNHNHGSRWWWWWYRWFVSGTACEYTLYTFNEFLRHSAKRIHKTKVRKKERKKKKKREHEEYAKKKVKDNKNATLNSFLFTRSSRLIYA